MILSGSGNIYFQTEAKRHREGTLLIGGERERGIMLGI